MIRKRWIHYIQVTLSRKVRRVCTVVFLCVSPLAMTGCYDREELEQQAFVSILGLDKAPGGLIDCTFQIALPVNPSGGGSKGGKQPLAGTGPMTVRAHSINEAMLLAGGSLERTLTFSHLSGVVFGSDLAEQGVTSYLQPLIRYREFRRTVQFGVTKGKAMDVIKSNEPMLDTSVVRVVDGIQMVGNRSGLIPKCRIHDVASALESPHQDILAPLYSINKFVEGEMMPDNSSVSYEAGDVRRNGGNPVEWMGGAVFRGDKVVDYINGEDSIYVRMLEGGVYHAKLDLSDPLQKGQDIGIAVHKERAPHYNITLSNPVKIHVDMPLDVDIVNVASGIDYAEVGNREKLERGLSEQLNQHMGGLLKRLLVKDQADVIPVSKYIRGKFSTYEQFAKYPWMKKLQTAQIVVDANVHVRRFGVQMDPLREKST